MQLLHKHKDFLRQIHAYDTKILSILVWHLLGQLQVQLCHQFVVGMMLQCMQIYLRSEKKI